MSDCRRFAVVTGATSGIGRSTAITLAHRGWQLKLCGQDALRLAESAGVCQASGASGVSTFLADLSDPDNVVALAAEVADEQSVVDVVVNSAGFGLFESIGLMESSVIRQMITLNTVAPWLLIKELMPLLCRAEPVATVVNVSSDADSTGFENGSAYCASKSGLLGLHRALRLELRDLGVRLVLVSPGRVDTCFNSKQPGDRPGALAADDVAEVIDFAVNCSPNIELHEVRLDSMSREGP